MAPGAARRGWVILDALAGHRLAVVGRFPGNGELRRLAQAVEDHVDDLLAVQRQRQGVAEIGVLVGLVEHRVAVGWRGPKHTSPQ